MTLEVIGAGFGRTGTMSLKVALEELGFGPCYHMTEVFTHPEHVESWRAAARGKTVDWQLPFCSYRATVDWPGCAFYEELIDRYPNAKVVLSESCYDSAHDTIYRASGTAPSSPILSLMSLFSPEAKRVKRARRMIFELIWEKTFDGMFEDREYATSIFERHNEEVKRKVPADRLLVYDVKDGWDPLCDFLEVDAPNKPFPRLNEAGTFRNRIRRRIALTYGIPAVTVLGVLVLLILRRHLRGLSRATRWTKRSRMQLYSRAFASMFCMCHQKQRSKR
jgi:hypothetical protein